MINRNRNRDELELMRRYRDPDDDPDGDPDAPAGSGPRGRSDRVNWFGIRFKESTIIITAFSITGLMIVLQSINILYRSRIPWIPQESWVTWAFSGLMTLLCFIAFSMFVATRIKFQRDIRESDLRMARMDGATEEEARKYARESEKEINRRIRWRSLFVALVVIILLPTIGTPFLVPWGNPLIAVAAAGVIIGGAFIWWYHREGLLEKLRRLF